jgi:hypothetical protein
VITEPSPEQNPSALRQRLLLALSDAAGSSAPDTAAGLALLCRSLVGEMKLVGATITLMAGDGTQGVAAASDSAIRAVDAVQFDVGEGPSQEAFSAGQPVLVVDLEKVDGRWPGFAPGTQSHGIGAVYAFPLQLGAIRLGALTCYAETPRALTREEVSVCALYAEVTTEFLIDQSSPTGLGPEEQGFLRDGVQIRTEVYQAQGMVMVELGVSLAEALVRLRASAFAAGVPLNELARDVVAGRQSLIDDRHPGGSADGGRPPPRNGDGPDA